MLYCSIELRRALLKAGGVIDVRTNELSAERPVVSRMQNVLVPDSISPFSRNDEFGIADLVVAPHEKEELTVVLLGLPYIPPFQ